ncbi:MAG: hypothetical protein EOO46_17640, partial [Flavobacterium sp.]
MTLHFRIYHPVKSKGRNQTFSEKLSYWSLWIAISVAILAMMIDKLFLIHELYYLLWLAPLGLLGNVISMFVRIGEHENLNGYFEGNIIFKEDYMEINNQIYPYQSISNLNFLLCDYYGKPTNNYRYGPMYQNGILNYISFTVDGEERFFNFEVDSEFLLDKLYFSLIDVICLGKIKYKREYLDLISHGFR